MTAPLEVFELELDGDTLIATLSSTVSESHNLDLRATSDLVQQRLNDPSVMNLVFDFGNARHVSSETIGAIAKLARRVRDTGGQAILCGISDEVQAVLKTIKLGYLWREFPSRETAFQWLRE